MSLQRGEIHPRIQYPSPFRRKSAATTHLSIYTISSHEAMLTPNAQLCQCSICRKVGGYMGSVNIMGNTKTLNIIRGKDKIKWVETPTSYRSASCGYSVDSVGCTSHRWSMVRTIKSRKRGRRSGVFVASAVVCCGTITTSIQM